MFRPQVAVNAAIAAGVRGQAAEPRGWSPQAIEAAYRLPAARESRQTVAVSIAYDTPQLGRYLAVYRQHYHLPPCTVSQRCLRIVNQQGRPSPLPRSGGIQRLVDRGHAGCVDDLGCLPALPHPRRGGQQQQRHQPGCH
jgi:hypothetical protein